MTTPNFRLLCAELADELEELIRDTGLDADLLNLARVALAEPVPPADGEVALPRNADMAAAMVLLGCAYLRDNAPESLAPQPEPEGPTREDVRQWLTNDIAWGSLIAPKQWRLIDDEFLSLLHRAVLARWSRP